MSVYEKELHFGKPRETRVVNVKQEPCDIYIGTGVFRLRFGPGNYKPFGESPEALHKYKDFIEQSPKRLELLRELKGKVLGCVCKPYACHGDVLVDLIEKYF